MSTRKSRAAMASNPAAIATTAKPVRELTGKAKTDFLGIVEILVKFDDKTGRASKYANPELHYMRKALIAADPENVRIFLRQESDWLYTALCELTAAEGAGRLQTLWMHEDGIAIERRTAPAGRPVHTITCAADCWQTGIDAELPEWAGQI